MFQIPYSISPLSLPSPISPLHSFTNLLSPPPSPFISQIFPCYPLTLTLILPSPLPVTKLQFLISPTLSPSKLTILASNTPLTNYIPLGAIKFQSHQHHQHKHKQQWQVKTWRYQQGKQKQQYQFWRVRIEGCLESEENLMKQVSIGGLKLYNERFEGTKYLYRIEVGGMYPKEVREVLESLEYRLRHKKEEKDWKECQNLEYLMERTVEEYELEREEERKMSNGKTINKKQKNFIKSNVVLQQIAKQYLIHDLYKQFPLDAPPSALIPPHSTHSPIPPSSHDLALITSIFQLYIQRVTPYYLDLLSSPQPKHNQKAIQDLWNAVKHQHQMPLIDQEMVFDLVIHFLKAEREETVRVTLEILREFLERDYTKTVAKELLVRVLLGLCQVYERQGVVEGEMTQTWKVNILALYPLMKSSKDEYFDILLNSKSIPVAKKIELVLLLLRSQQITSYHSIVNFLQQLILSAKDSKDQQKRKPSSKQLFSLQPHLYSLLDILQQHLPTNIMVPIRKDINLILEGGVRRNSIPITSTTTKKSFCQFCLTEDPTFLEGSQSLTMHHFKDCICLTKCKECDLVIEIVTMREHCLGECERKEGWKECGGCGMAVRRREMEEGVHRNSCPREREGYCPLCLENVGEVQRHIRGKKCLRNPRG